jgi:sialic acid synthase SpsE
MSRLDEARASDRCYVIAEAGSNHNTEWNLAEQLIAVAAAVGADAVKFQAFRAERLYPRGAGAAAYLEDAEDIYDIVARMELPESWLPELAAETRRRGIDLLVSAFDEASADAVDPFVPAHKLASYELTHEPLLRRLAAFGKPLFVSTGAATLPEVGAAVEAARDAGAHDLTLLQCTAAYPARLEALNVSAILELRARFGVDAGLSDHSVDPTIAPVLAIGYGASVIEKHFTLDRDLPGPDHKFALDPEGLRAMILAIRGAETARGSGLKEVHADELELRDFARRSVFAVRDIEEGEPFDATSIAVLRDGTLGQGLPPARYPSLLLQRAARRIAANTPVQESDVR